MQHGNMPKALDQFYKSLKIRERTDDKKGMANCYNNIAGVYDSQDDLESALLFYDKALKIREEINDELGMAESYNNLGALHSLLGNSEIANKYYFKSLETYQMLDYHRGIAICYSNLGSVTEERDKVKSLGILSKKFGNIFKHKLSNRNGSYLCKNCRASA